MMEKYIGYLFCTSILLSCSYPTTPAEKVAFAYCNCAKEYELENYITILKSKDEEKIDQNYEAMSIIRLIKKCAKENAEVNKSDAISEKEISEAMEKQCPEVFYFVEEFGANNAVKE